MSLKIHFFFFRFSHLDGFFFSENWDALSDEQGKQTISSGYPVNGNSLPGFLEWMYVSGLLLDVIPSSTG